MSANTARQIKHSNSSRYNLYSIFSTEKNSAISFEVAIETIKHEQRFECDFHVLRTPAESRVGRKRGRFLIMEIRQKQREVRRIDAAIVSFICLSVHVLHYVYYCSIFIATSIIIPTIRNY